MLDIILLFSKIGGKGAKENKIIMKLQIKFAILNILGIKVVT